jgi:transposase
VLGLGKRFAATASRWAHAVASGGVTALRARKSGGRPRFLTDEQLATVRDTYTLYPMTTGVLADFIRLRFGVAYNHHHCGRMVRAMGLNPMSRGSRVHHSVAEIEALLAAPKVEVIA